MAAARKRRWRMLQLRARTVFILEEICILVKQVGEAPQQLIFAPRQIFCALQLMRLASIQRKCDARGRRPAAVRALAEDQSPHSRAHQPVGPRVEVAAARGKAHRVSRVSAAHVSGFG
jgi:hypothetical protein